MQSESGGDTDDAGGAMSTQELLSDTLSTLLSVVSQHHAVATGGEYDNEEDDSADNNIAPPTSHYERLRRPTTASLTRANIGQQVQHSLQRAAGYAPRSDAVDALRRRADTVPAQHRLWLVAQQRRPGDNGAGASGDVHVHPITTMGEGVGTWGLQWGLRGSRALDSRGAWIGPTSRVAADDGFAASGGAAAASPDTSPQRRRRRRPTVSGLEWQNNGRVARATARWVHRRNKTRATAQQEETLLAAADSACAAGPAAARKARATLRDARAVVDAQRVRAGGSAAPGTTGAGAGAGAARGADGGGATPFKPHHVTGHSFAGRLKKARAQRAAGEAREARDAEALRGALDCLPAEYRRRVVGMLRAAPSASGDGRSVAERVRLEEKVAAGDGAAAVVAAKGAGPQQGGAAADAAAAEPPPPPERRGSPVQLDVFHKPAFDRHVVRQARARALSDDRNAPKWSTGDAWTAGPTVVAPFNLSCYRKKTKKGTKAKKQGATAKATTKANAGKKKKKAAAKKRPTHTAAGKKARRRRGRRGARAHRGLSAVPVRRVARKDVTWDGNGCKVLIEPALPVRWKRQHRGGGGRGGGGGGGGGGTARVAHKAPIRIPSTVPVDSSDGFENQPPLITSREGLIQVVLDRMVGQR